MTAIGKNLIFMMNETRRSQFLIFQYTVYTVTMEQRDFFLRISVVPLNSFNTKSFYKNNNYILTTKHLLLQQNPLLCTISRHFMACMMMMDETTTMWMHMLFLPLVQNHITKEAAALCKPKLLQIQKLLFPQKH